jgi:hypothetical protein
MYLLFYIANEVDGNSSLGDLSDGLGFRVSGLEIAVSVTCRMVIASD